MKYWTTQKGERIAVKDMTTSHIENCIKYLEKNMPLDEDDEYLVADHWTLEGSVVLIPGSKSYQKNIDAFKRELKRRGGENKIEQS
jgi:hypothetical protein